MMNVEDDKEIIHALLDKLITLYHVDARTKYPIQTCQGAAMRAAQMMLCGKGGRVLTFCTNLCASGVGSLKSRDGFALYNKPEETKLF